MSKQRVDNIPAMQKAAVTARFEDSPNKTVIKEVPVPELKAGQILVKVNWSGLCHNDVAVMRNYWSHFPFQTLGQGISGHEGVGDVVAIADDVVAEGLWSLGDRVGVKWVASVCHTCEFCTSGNEVNCLNIVFSGFTTPGTFQQYVATDARTALRIPDGVSDEEAASMLCGGLTSFVATKKSQVPPGKWIVLLGAGGGAGHLGLQFAKTMGMRTIAVDLGPEKGKLCREVGAEAYIDASMCLDLAEEVKGITGHGAHSAIVFAPAQDMYNAAPSLVRPGGTIVVAAFVKDISWKMSIVPMFFASAQQTIIGTTTGSRKDAEEMFEYLVNGLVRPVIHKGLLTDVESKLDLMEAKKVSGKVVLNINL